MRAASCAGSEGQGWLAAGNAALNKGGLYAVLEHQSVNTADVACVGAASRRLLQASGVCSWATWLDTAAVARRANCRALDNGW